MRGVWDVPLTMVDSCGTSRSFNSAVFSDGVVPPSDAGGVSLGASEAVSASSMIVANFLSTCFNAGRLIGLLMNSFCIRLVPKQ